MRFPTDPPKEYKTFPFEMINLDTTGRTLEGYASVFNNIDRVGDIVIPGAFAKTLVESGSRLMLLWQHDNKEPLGPVALAREDMRGLYTKSIISDTARGRDVLALLKDGASLGMSFGYDPTDSEPSLMPDGQAVRKLKQVRLHEISLVTFPANPEARVTALKEEGEPAEAKPYPNEHSCRLKSPGKFQGDSIRRMTRRHEDQEYSVIMGRLEGESTMTEQAYRYPKDKWTEAQARAHCETHDGTSFEPAVGEGKAAWDAAWVNDLPDRAFLYISPGGEKDPDGKTTPRALRHFPYRDADGAIDLPHLRNAIARIPQSNAPGLDDAKKQALQDKARDLLEKANAGKDIAPAESKVGRVIAKRNADRIKGIKDQLAKIHELISELENDAGLLTEDAPSDKPAEPASAQRAEPPEDKALTLGAGPDNPPTPDKEATLRRIAILEAELAFMEV